jgi:hypothetical protein
MKSRIFLEGHSNALCDTKCNMLFNFDILIEYCIKSCKEGVPEDDRLQGFPVEIPLPHPLGGRSRNVDNLCINWR